LKLLSEGGPNTDELLAPPFLLNEGEPKVGPPNTEVFEPKALGVVVMLPKADCIGLEGRVGGAEIRGEVLVRGMVGI